MGINDRANKSKNTRLFLRKLKTIIGLSLLYYILKTLPILPIKWNENENFIFKNYFKFTSQIRKYLNQLSLDDRERIVKKYLIPTINIFFNKNYVNCAQVTLLICEEYFLSKKTDKEFEEVLSLFSKSAIDAGLRFREKFPLQKKDKICNTPNIGVASYYTAKSGFEVILGLGKHLKKFSTKLFGMKSFEEINSLSLETVCGLNDIELVLPKKNILYNVFVLRRLIIENDIDIIFWPTPPFHMFFFFAFGLAPKQVWFTHYLRSNIEFPYLDNCISPGGAGQVTEKFYNGKMWQIVPHVIFNESLMDKNKLLSVVKEEKLGNTILFTPGRLEKIKQPDFLKALVQIMKACPNTIFKWTGACHDNELKNYFADNGLQNRNFYIPWMINDTLWKEIGNSDIILAPFPLSLGTIEIMSAHLYKPIVSMYNEENSMYWRDPYWEANQGNQDLQKICMDENGNSILAKNRTIDEYVKDAINVINNEELAKKYAKVYHDAYEYTYLNNPNNIEKIFSDIIEYTINKNNTMSVNCTSSDNI